MVKSDRDNLFFLWTIMRQQERQFKFIDWAQVARAHDMTKDHAARMRFFRLKRELEEDFPQDESTKSSSTSSKTSKPRKPRETKSKGKKKIIDAETDDDEPLAMRRHFKSSPERADFSIPPTGYMTPPPFFDGRQIKMEELTSSYMPNHASNCGFPWSYGVPNGGVAIKPEPSFDMQGLCAIKVDPDLPDFDDIFNRVKREPSFHAEAGPSNRVEQSNGSVFIEILD